ncbi:diguanylate cyclase domain-containing protein [Sporomusa acidovorans]|uniref:diguanylate cyclase domain-containing protein n=1 Tax=Sporomusa acidovorans TaxID=112900 RepID=UPI00088C806D|nr:hypothetical protein SPACI_15930 [Sporomusa acidovorans DSM 3132]SDF88769.1 Diguanylate cyclase, GGDEF domain [Sporomusa acidovorans]
MFYNHACFILTNHLTISSGIISLEQTQDFKDLLVRADQALYKTKERKNVIVMVNGL